MSSVERNAKIYGAVETETNITFTGFCKKIYDTEQQEVEVFIDDKKIDVILANQKNSKIEDTYEVFDTHGFCFTYKLPKEYVGEKHKLEFKTINGDQLIHSPIITMDQEYPKYNENCFIESLNEPIDEEKIKDMYCPNSIGFLATEENLEDVEFVEYIKDLSTKFPDITIKAIYFNNEQYKLLQILDNEIKNLNYLIPKNLYEILTEIEIFIWNSNLRGSNITKYINIYLISVKFCRNIYSFEYRSERKYQTLEEVDELLIKIKSKYIQNFIKFEFIYDKNDLYVQKFNQCLHNEVIYTMKLNLDMAIGKLNFYEVRYINYVYYAINNADFKYLMHRINCIEL